MEFERFIRKEKRVFFFFYLGRIYLRNFKWSKEENGWHLDFFESVTTVQLDGTRNKEEKHMECSMTDDNLIPIHMHG